MRQRGKKSRAGLAIVNVNGKPPRPEPPSSLPEAERAVFVDLVAASDPEHFRLSDLPFARGSGRVRAAQGGRRQRQGIAVARHTTRGDQGNGSAVDTVAAKPAKPNRSEDAGSPATAPGPRTVGVMRCARHAATRMLAGLKCSAL